MAGGRGERFWPVSREKTPKQLITLLGDRSFLQQAVDRVLPLVPLREYPGHHQRRPRRRKCASNCRSCPRRTWSAEPIGRDTCAAVTLGAALVGRPLDHGA